MFTGALRFGTYRTIILGPQEKSQFSVSLDFLECRRKKTVILLSVGSNVHQDTNIWYLSHDRFRSSTTFIRKDGRFDVSFNKLDSRWKQTVFLVVVGNCCTWSWGFGWYRPRFFNNFHLKKLSYLSSFFNFESRCKKTVTLLIVGSHVHQDSTIRYLSNDTFGSSTTFNREDCPFGVSFNKLDDRWKQTVFSSGCPQKVSPGHELSIAIEQESPTTFVRKKVISLLRSLTLRADARRLLHC